MAKKSQMVDPNDINEFHIENYVGKVLLTEMDFIADKREAVDMADKSTRSEK